jgi:hypothetical protein
MTTVTTTNADTSLTMRALAAAEQRRDDIAEPASWRNPRWAARAEASATALARILGVGREQVAITADRTRAYGGVPWPTLTVTGCTHEFTAAFNDPDQLMILAPCPECGNQVPLVRLRHLADLGDLIGSHRPAEPVPEFLADPGHHHRCPHATD